jgi:hypothetical protein
VTPNPYEAPTCQEAKEVRRKNGGLPPHVSHALLPAIGVTDLISNSGFAGTCPAPNTYRGSTLRPLGCEHSQQREAAAIVLAAP